MLMRDTYYTLNAFNNIGHFEESEKYFQYILNTTIEEDDRYQPLYGIDGTKALIEKELELKGYQGNQPVRIPEQGIKQASRTHQGSV